MKTHFPLKTMFSSSKAKADLLAEKIKNGSHVETPFYLGAAKISSVELVNGIPCLWVDLNPSGKEGFVQSKLGKGFNLWSVIPLDDQWSYISED